jgi:hypothetical protein
MEIGDLNGLRKMEKGEVEMATCVAKERSLLSKRWWARGKEL